MQSVSLVTGGAGFIGSHIAEFLCSSGHTVLVLDDLSGGKKENVPAEASFIEGSITDSELVDEIFSSHSIDYVYHCAAYAAEGLSHFIRKYNYENNLIGSVNLINASVNHGVKCFVFTSSIAVYGDHALPHTEDQHPRPKDPYGIAKYAVEMDLENARSLFGLNYIIFRPHNVYGSRQNIGDKYRNVVGIFMNQALQGKSLTVFGDGKQTRAFTHVSSIVEPLANAVNYPAAFNRTFNIGSEEWGSVNELAEQINHLFDNDKGVVHLEQRQEATHVYADHQQFETVFGKPTNVSLPQGLQEMAEWVKKTGVQKGQTFDHIEIEKKLPPSWKNNH